MIARQEFVERMARLQRRVAENELDLFLVSSEESIYYLTGIQYKPLERPFFVVVRPQDPPALLVPALEAAHLSAAPNVEQVVHYWDYPSPPGEGWPERLLALLGSTARMGIEPSLPMEIALHLADRSPQVLPLVEVLRLVKSPAEVEMIRHAARFSDLAVAKVIDASYFGVSVLELFSQGRPVQLAIMKDVGYEALTTSVLAASWPAPLSAQPHGVPEIGDRLREGPHIALALLRVNGYAAECERTYFLAPPTTEVRAAFAAMMEARRRAYALVRPGIPCAEIDARTREFLTGEGFGPHLLHRTGHGFGLGNHEGPWVADGSADLLQENMVISIEPGIYLPGVGGIRHSDTTLVTRDGYENLTRYATDLDSLTVLDRKLLTRGRGAMVRRVAGLR